MPSYLQNRARVAAAAVIILCLLKSRRRIRRSEGRIAKKSVQKTITNVRAKAEKKKTTEEKGEERTRRKGETSLCPKTYNLRRPISSRRTTTTTENGNNISQGKTSQDAVSLGNSSDPCLQTPKIDIKGEIDKDVTSQDAVSLRNSSDSSVYNTKTDIKEEIDVDEEEWKMQLQEKEDEIPTENVEWMSTGLKIEPEEEDDELEPVAAITIPSLHEDLLQEY